jgi:transposase
VLSLAPTTRIFVANGATDLRRSFDRLAAMATEVLGQDPFSGHLFCFFNRRRDRVKLLYWERGGFWVLCKRREITARDLWYVLEGVEVVRERVRYERPVH